MPKIELSVVKEVLEEALDYEIQSLEGVALEDSDGVRVNRETVAQYTRDLLKLADALDLASSLVRQQYWRIKAEGEAGVLASTLVPRGAE